MLTHVQQCIETEAHKVKSSDEWRLPLRKLKAFIFLLYVRRALCGKNRPILEFWDKDWGVLLNTISYLGKNETRTSTQRLSENALVKIVGPHLGKGRNVTIDIFLL